MMSYSPEVLNFNQLFLKLNLLFLNILCDICSNIHGDFWT